MTTKGVPDEFPFLGRIKRIDRHGDRIHMHLHEPAPRRFASTWTQPNTIGSRP
ncbi:hypothetical protein ABIB82_003199 [Bradyrhizobium sp. i1.8.4]